MTGEYDIAVIGGGLVGAALAWGVAGAGRHVALLDEGDVALRAARGNFALVWVQGKGLGRPDYAAWTARSAAAWADFAAALAGETGIDLRYSRPGGLQPVRPPFAPYVMSKIYRSPDKTRFSARRAAPPPRCARDHRRAA